jgi:hypothetical protein
VFKESCENTGDDERSGHPRSHRTNENVVKVQNMVHSDRCLGIRAYCMEILKQLHKAAHRRRPELWPSDWVLHNDTALAHKMI